MIASCLLACSMGVAQAQVTLVDFRRMLDVDVIKAQPRFDLGDEVIAFPVAGAEYSAEVTFEGNVIKSVQMSTVQIPAFDKFLILRPVGDGFTEVSGLGSYSYKLKSGSQVLKQLDFKVSQEQSGDPFKPTPRIVIDGPWRTMANFQSNPARPEEALTFECYSHLGESSSTSAQQFSITVLKGGATVAQTRPYVLSKQNWELQSVPLWKPDNRNYFRNADLLALNSEFEVVVKHGSKRVKSFKGSVVGKVFKHLPEASTSFKPAENALLPKSMIIPGGSVGKAFLVDVFWMKGN